MKSYDFSSLGILIVASHPGMRTVIKSILRALHCKNWTEATDGIEALDILRGMDADLAIVDGDMTALDGIEFTRMLRTSPDTRHPFLPVIMLSAQTTQRRVSEARDAGIHEFLAKPVSVKSIYGRIVSIIERPRKFIRTTDYFGPDRHRRQDPGYKGPDRRNAAAARMTRERERQETGERVFRLSGTG